MATRISKLSYQRLRQEVLFEDDEYHHNKNRRIIVKSARKWLVNKLKRVRVRRKLKVKVAGFRNFFKIRRVKVARLSWATLLKRLKESQSHFGDLFTGNYLFMQVTPTSFKNNKINANLARHHKYNLSGFPSGFNNYAIKKVA